MSQVSSELSGHGQGNPSDKPEIGDFRVKKIGVFIMFGFCSVVKLDDWG